MIILYAAFLNNELVTAREEAVKESTNPKQFARRHYFCPHCKREVQLIVKKKTAYFKHLPQVINMAGEKDEHAQSKELLKDALQAAKFDAQTEVSLANGRLRADVLASPKLAFEVHCAPLNKSEFMHRHLLYQQIGIKDIWIVGKRHFLQHYLKKTQLIFFRENELWNNYYLEVNPYQRSLRLKYNVKLEPLTDMLHFQTASFSLDSIGLEKLWYFKPRLKKYQIDSSVQKNYLKMQLAHKSIKGLQIGAKLYQKQMTVDELPQWVFSKVRSVNSADNATTYFTSSEGAF